MKLRLPARDIPVHLRSFFKPAVSTLRAKSCCGIPWRVAFALMDDGWILRSDIIFAKDSPMPEPVRDRPVRAHEYLFLFAQNEKYHCDMKAIREPAVCKHPSGNGYNRPERQSYTDKKGPRGSTTPWQPVEWRNRRDVWHPKRTTYKHGHVAAFPEDLIEPCILAGCPLGGTVLDIFSGSGTVGAVAEKHRRSSILIDLDPACEAMMRTRLEAAMPRPAKVTQAVQLQLQFE